MHPQADSRNLVAQLRPIWLSGPDAVAMHKSHQRPVSGNSSLGSPQASSACPLLSLLLQADMQLRQARETLSGNTVRSSDLGAALRGQQIGW
jgi:hypothetical protein